MWGYSDPAAQTHWGHVHENAHIPMKRKHMQNQHTASLYVFSPLSTIDG